MIRNIAADKTLRGLVKAMVEARLVIVVVKLVRRKISELN